MFILTHGRPDNVITYKTLLNCGYTGSIYLVVDNEDKALDQYINNFGVERIKIFDKKAMAYSVDEGNNFDERRTITHARNACFIIARKLEIEYFIQLDDDYKSFDFRIDITCIEDKTGIHKPIKNINIIFDLMLTFYKSINALSIAFAQGGDFIGGLNNGKGSYRFSKRKCMNSFICSTEREFQFIGAMNEDVNTYVTLGSRGNLFFTIPFISLTQSATQGNDKGITDMYLKYGTYCKSFTTIMMQPSSTRVAMMNAKHIRLHHLIDWPTTVPVIIEEKYKKISYHDT